MTQHTRDKPWEPAKPSQQRERHTGETVPYSDDHLGVNKPMADDSMTSHNLDTREKLPVCERLRHDPWPADDGARLEAADTIEALYEALFAVIANADDLDVIAMGDTFDRAVAALSRARNGGQP